MGSKPPAAGGAEPAHPPIYSAPPRLPQDFGGSSRNIYAELEWGGQSPGLRCRLLPPCSSDQSCVELRKGAGCLCVVCMQECGLVTHTLRRIIYHQGQCGCSNQLFRCHLGMRPKSCFFLQVQFYFSSHALWLCMSSPIDFNGSYAQVSGCRIAAQNAALSSSCIYPW